MSEREASISRTTDGDPLGVMLFVDAEDLRALGVDPEERDRVTFRVEDGDLRMS